MNSKEAPDVHPVLRTAATYRRCIFSEEPGRVAPDRADTARLRGHAGINSQLTTGNSQLARAFTLTELLVVIGIIVLLLALAVPALRVLGGGRDIASAENQIAAILGRARAQAISDRTVAGVMFFLDPKDSRVKAVLVEQTPANVAGFALPTGAASGTISLDLATDTLPTGDCTGGNSVADFFLLPPGVAVQMIDNCSFSTAIPPVRQDDGYLGFNSINNYNGAGNPPPGGRGQATIDKTLSPPLLGVEYGGTILFSSSGKLVAVPYIFHTAVGGAGTAYTKLGQLLFGTTQYDLTQGSNWNFVSPTPIAASRTSQYGLVVFNHDAFIAKGYTDADAEVVNPTGLPGSYQTIGGVAAGAPSEQSEEDWLDQNSTPLIIDRYNGSLIRGE